MASEDVNPDSLDHSAKDTSQAQPNDTFNQIEQIEDQSSLQLSHLGASGTSNQAGSLACRSREIVTADHISKIQTTLSSFHYKCILNAAELYKSLRPYARRILMALGLMGGITCGLVILAPLIFELLGFSVIGPVAGSIAAGWQASMGGTVAAGSLFSFLQGAAMGGAAMGTLGAIGVGSGVVAAAAGTAVARQKGLIGESVKKAKGFFNGLFKKRED